MMKHLLTPFLFFALSHCWNPTDPIPSCLREGATWDQSGIFDVVPNTDSADDCQAICAETKDCISFTWVSKDSPIFPLSCGLFSRIGEEMICDGCVSGSKECPCTVKGECDSDGSNMIGAVPQVESAADCKLLCEGDPACSFFSYFNDPHLAKLCLLFSSCEAFYEECEACETGAKECNLCSYEDTANGDCPTTDGQECEEGWESFGNHCYKMIDNSGSHYLDASVCSTECQMLGGELASIHSQEENDFLASLLRKPASVDLRYAEQTTFVGLSKNGPDGSFTWTDGTPMDFMNWRHGQPNGDSVSGGCVLLGFDKDVPDQWDDWSCCSMNIPCDCICKK